MNETSMTSITKQQERADEDKTTHRSLYHQRTIETWILNHRNLATSLGCFAAAVTMMVTFSGIELIIHHDSG